MSRMITFNRVAVYAGLSAALLVSACHGNRTYSLGSSGSFGTAGPAGERGPEGPAGPAGPQGPAGRDGLDGLNGLNGANGLGAVVIGDRTIIGGGGGAPGPLGVNILSPGQSPGQVATVGVLAGGSVAAIAVGQPNSPTPPAGGSPTGLLGLTVGGNQVLGQGQGNPAVDLAVLSPTGASGTAVSGNVLSNGQPLGVGLTNPAGAQTPGGVVGGVKTAVGGVVGGLQPGGTAPPAPTLPGVGGVLGGVLGKPGG